jgi:hypothetical protein
MLCIDLIFFLRQLYMRGDFSKLRQISSSIKITDHDIKQTQFYVPQSW